ncbi:MAG TPA: pitrilysin family protein [Nitrospiria bacterium]|jgi:zinc protease|nr:pitrilysin family protein [Nitrospiria bacterium]
MPILLGLLFTWLLFFSSSPALAREIQTRTLENGLKVILVEEHKAPVVTIQIWYRAGSRNEVTGKTGLAHLTEHMMFKGTPKYGKGEFSRMIAKVGGTENAFTSKDYTAYFENLSADQIGLALNLESDRMTNLLLDTKEFQLEREVVKEERRLRTDDDPQSLVVEYLYAMAYLVHPYHAPTLGWMTDLDSLVRNDVTAFYKRYYSTNNAILVVVGDINPEQLFPKIQQTFGRVPKGFPVPPFHIVEPEQSGERRFVIKKEAQLPFVFAGYPVPNFSHPDNYALGVLANILFSGKSSRLYRSLVYEQKLALDVGGEYPNLSANPDLFYLYGIPPPGKNADDLEKGIYAEIRKVSTEPISDQELQKAKNQIEAGFIMGQDSNFFQAMQIGSAEAVGAGYGYQESYVENIRKVTKEDVMRVAKTYLIEDHRTVGILIPQPHKE